MSSPILVIRNEQLAVFAASADREFAGDMAAHLRASFPEEAAALDEGALLAHVRHAVERGRAHGLRAKRSLCQYLNLSVVLGRDFDADPEHAWVLGYLDDPAVPDEVERMGRLYAEALRREELVEKRRRMREEFFDARR